MSEAIFKLNHLQHYCVVDGPCTAKVRVATNVTESNSIDDDHPRYLVPLRVSTKEKLEKLAEGLAEKDSVPFKEVRHNFMTGAIFKNTISDIELLPVKGEEIIATFDYISDGSLQCTGITLIPRIKLKSFNINLYDKTKTLFDKIIANSKK